jgi:2-polyprenyl-6-methoxyphenol hydroxylase-like FAD-dependent oxidoreductase
VNERAIVIGAGISGLLTAYVLSAHFDEVLVLDSDQLPEPAAARAGTPQDMHVHLLHQIGLETLDSFFPGIAAELADLGAVSFDPASKFRWFLGSGYANTDRAEGRMRFTCLSRPLLEYHVRQRLLQCERVKIVDRSRVHTYLWSASRERIVGVVGEQLEHASREFEGSLVVDASGRASNTMRWLETDGWPVPRVAQVRVGVGYSTRIYSRPRVDSHAPLAIGVQPSAPTGTRGGVLFPIEHDRWIATLAGWSEDYPPRDVDGFDSFLLTLPCDDIAHAIQDSAPITTPATYRFHSSVWCRFDRLRSFPKGLLIVGDAIASLNPVYGQGMTVAALEAATLSSLLGSGPHDDLATRFFRETRKIIWRAWSTAAFNDHRHPFTSGSYSRASRLLSPYLTSVERAALCNSDSTVELAETLSMRQSPASLLKPRTMFRSLNAAARSRS